MTATRLFSRRFVRINPADRGIDVAAFLEPRLSNRITHYLPVWAALLDDEGRVLFDFLVWPGGYGFLLDCEACHAEDLVDYLRPECAPAGITVSIDDGLATHYHAYSGDRAAPDPPHRALGQRSIQNVGRDDESVDERWLTGRLTLGIAKDSAELGFGESSWLQCNAFELKGPTLDKHVSRGRARLIAERINGVPNRLLVIPTAVADPGPVRLKHSGLGLSVDLRRLTDLPISAIPDWHKASAAINLLVNA